MMPNTNRPLRLRIRLRRGFSLAECALSLMLTSIVIMGALSAVSSTYRTRTLIQSQWQSTQLAQSLLTEVMQSYYVDPGATPVFGLETGESTGNRSLFNDVDDYNSWSESPPVDKSGTALPGYTGWTRQVGVSWVLLILPTVSWATETGLKRITVTVTDPQGNQTKLYGLRANIGMGEQKPVGTTTFVEWAGVSITAGTNNTTMSTSVNFTNGAN
jgi:hypothetical protein